MLFDLIFTFFLFNYFNSWILFIVNLLIVSSIKITNGEINTIIDSPNFISNNMEMEDNNYYYKYNTLDDSFKALKSTTFGQNIYYRTFFEQIKLFIIYPFEYLYSRSEIIYIPQIYDKCDNYLICKCNDLSNYILSLDCSKKFKIKIHGWLTIFMIRAFFNSYNNKKN